jgi:hypothetical protein
VAGSRRLGKAYDGLSGPDLLQALAESGEAAVLEAFWRLGNVEVMAQTAGPLCLTGDPHLLGLILDEVESPHHERRAVHSAIVEAIDHHRPQLQKSDAERLAGLLREGSLSPQFHHTRPNLLAWLVSQPGKAGGSAALDVIAGEIEGFEHPNVRTAAYLRCRESDTLLASAAPVVAERFEQLELRQAWPQVAEFIEYTSRDEANTPAAVRPLVDRLVETAPEAGASASFSNTLRRLALDSALDTVERALAEQLTDSPGSQAIASLLPDVSPAQRRAKLWALAFRHQPALLPTLKKQGPDWDEAEWRRVLRELATPEPVVRPALDYLLRQAPLELTSELIRLAIVQLAPSDGLLAVVGERLRERVKVINEAEGDDEAWVAAPYWPKAGSEDEIEKFDFIVRCLERSLHTELVVRGYLAGKLSAAVAARLVPEGAVAHALELVPEGERNRWVKALAERHPDEIGNAIAGVTTPENFDVDVVAALAPKRPDAAFARVSPAWLDLSGKQKDELIELLARYATPEHVPVLSTVIKDDHRDNTKRRGQAARRVGEVLVPGMAIPEPVIELLSSNRQDLRSAAVEVIGRVKPRDPTLIGRLHDVASAGGAAGTAASDALEALAAKFLAEFAAAKDKTELQALMPVLAAIGRPSVLQPLFGHVGADAVYDDPALHREAAAAIRQAAERIGKVSAEEQEALVALLDAEEQETDLAARADLLDALAQLQLGENAALKVLYDEIAITPKTAPELLFGSEREPLVRQLGLYARERERGAEGWRAELAHLDNIAERLVRSAYLVADGTSTKIVEQIRNDPAEPDYGALISALASTKQLNGIQASCQELHDARCEYSEIPHAGKKADEATMTTARRCFARLAKVCVGTLQAHHRRS